jgi:hypothetical protein
VLGIYMICLLLVGEQQFLACKSNANENTIPENISLYKTIEIPVQLFTGSGANLDAEKLTIFIGREDEMPEGPTSFDVRQNGDLVICDPLLQRVVVYDSLGRYIRQLELHLPVSRIQTINGDDSWKLQIASSGEYFLLDSRATSSSLRMQPVQEGFDDDQNRAILLKENKGIVFKSSKGNQTIDSFNVNFGSQEKLISIQNFGTDQKGNTMVGLESARGTDSVLVNRIIQKYNNKNVLVAQIRDIDVNLFVYPIDQFRIRNERCFQMIPLKDKVIIHIWKLNQ